jgi:hypothetical protein
LKEDAVTEFFMDSQTHPVLIQPLVIFPFVSCCHFSHGSLNENSNELNGTAEASGKTLLQPIIIMILERGKIGIPNITSFSFCV